jgi:hypothetical protein
MHLLAGRLFLLLLLGVDWATDPYHGTSPLSEPMFSQEAVPLSPSYREDIRSASTPAPQPPFLTHDPARTPQLPARVFLLPEEPPARPPGADLVYVLRALLR